MHANERTASAFPEGFRNTGSGAKLTRTYRVRPMDNFIGSDYSELRDTLEDPPDENCKLRMAWGPGLP